MRAELDIFSGRPNPQWELSDETARKLLDLEKLTLSAERLQGEPPPLGYRGFHYGEEGKMRSVYRGIVRKDGMSFRESQPQIERLLLSSLPGEFGSLRDYVLQEIEL